MSTHERDITAHLILLIKWGLAHCVIGLFYYAVTILVRIETNGKITGEYWIGEDLKGSCRGLIDILYRHLFGGTEDNTKNSANPEPWPRFKPSTFQMQAERITATLTYSAFGLL
jgi:hypothetical protein